MTELDNKAMQEVDGGKQTRLATGGSPRGRCCGGTYNGPGDTVPLAHFSGGSWQGFGGAY